MNELRVEESCGKELSAERVVCGRAVCERVLTTSILPNHSHARQSRYASVNMSSRKLLAEQQI